MSHWRRSVDKLTVFAYFTTFPVLNEHAELSFVIRSLNGDRTANGGVWLTCNEVNVCSRRHIIECCATVYCYECVTLVLVCALESPSAVSLAAVEGVLSLTQCRHCLANLIQSDDVLCEVSVKCLRHVTVGCICSEVCCAYVSFKIVSEVCATCILNGVCCTTRINLATFLEFHLTTVIDTRNTTESKHPGEVFSPLCRTTVETCAVAWAWTVVVRVYINDIICCVVVVIVLAVQTHCVSYAVERVVYGEVDDIETRSLRVVRLVPSAVLKQCIVAARLVFCVLFANRHRTNGSVVAFLQRLSIPPFR